jgi:Tol biopolymer transport system component
VDSVVGKVHYNLKERRLAMQLRAIAVCALVALVAMSFQDAQGVTFTKHPGSTDDGNESAAFLSPDGTKIVFMGSGGPYGEGRTFWLMNADGSNSTQLFDPLEGITVAAETAPCIWAPDSRHLACHIWDEAAGYNPRGEGGYSLYTFDTATMEKALVLLDSTRAFPRMWMGDWIYFLSYTEFFNDGKPWDKINLFRIHPDGTGLEQLTDDDDFDPESTPPNLGLTVDGVPHFIDSWCSFQPLTGDGRMIFYTGQISGNADLYFIPAAGLPQYRGPAPDAPGWDPLPFNDPQAGEWSPVVDPSGTKLAFISNRLLAANLYIGDLNTGELWEITTGGISAGDLSWLPDGQSIMFSGKGVEDLPTSDIWILSDLGDAAGGPSTAVEEVEANILPEGFSLSQNYPNPFNPSTFIEFSLPSGNVFTTLAIYNSLGQLVRTLISEELEGGKLYRVDWDGRDNSGVSQASGVYVYELRAGDSREAKKMILSK